MKHSISALLVLLTLMLGGASSAATDPIPVDISWSAASGSVVEYAVFVSRNGAPLPSVPEQIVNDTRATLLGDAGEVIAVQVAGVNDAGMQGPLSEPSDPFQFPVPPPPPDPTPPPSEPPPDDDPDLSTEDPPAPPPDSGDALYFEDFESYGDGEDPQGWLDTAAQNSMLEDPSLFETFELTDGSVAFGTNALRRPNIHSHLRIAGSSAWSAYELSGLLSIDHARAGIGVTLYSDYPNSDSYYRLRRYGKMRSFHLSPHGLPAVTCQGTTDTGVVPEPGIWYRFRFRALPESGGTRVQARVWREGAGEPSAWQADCLDPAASFEAGAPGLWSMGRGTKLWDDLAVMPVDGGGPEPAPPSSDPELYFADFEGYRDGEDPQGWLDTAAKNSMREDPGLFETFELTDGSMAFGTRSTERNIHSHLALTESYRWSAYELSGLLSIDNRRGGIGVTLYSDYPNSNSYYRLRREGASGSFQLSPRGLSAFTCQGTTDTRVVPEAGAWYHFRFRALPETGGTRLQARVWAEGAAEPSAWQADCLDTAGSFEAGAPGVWSKGLGTKLWDDIAVEEVRD